MTDGTDDSTPRARSPRMARDERRAQVLRIAQELFSSEGFHHVSMDDIAERAEVSKPVLYRHFPSKLDLYLAVVDQNGADLLVAVDTAVSGIEQGPVRRGDGRDVIAAIVEAYIMFVEGAGESSALLFESDVTHDADVRARVEHASSEAARRISVVLSQVTALPLDDASMLAVSLISMAQGAATYRLRQPSEVGPERTIELVSQLAWGGVSALIRPDFEYEDA